MATDMGRGIIAPDNHDNIGTGASEMRTLAATTSAAIDDVSSTLQSEVDQRVRKDYALDTFLPRDEAERYGIEGRPGPEGPPSDIPGPPGPGGAIALEETDPGCFVESDVTWMQWDTTVGTVVRAWNPNTETYQMIYGDTGWRELPLPERFISGRVLIRRKNDVVNIRFEGVEITDVHPDNHPQEYITAAGYIPAGFRPQRYDDRHSAVVNGLYASHSTTMGIGQQSRLMLFHKIGGSNIGIGTARASGELSFTTNSTWPTSLPGTPA